MAGQQPGKVVDLDRANLGRRNAADEKVRNAAVTDALIKQTSQGAAISSEPPRKAQCLAMIGLA
jgi:hypothetical protein